MRAQATRVKFIFGPDALEVRIGDAESEVRTLEYLAIKSDPKP